jgi:prepilin-type processing-associated H-X9-DG protein
LVVVAIIAVLVAVLLPALGNAREIGRRVVCQSKIRQFGLGVQMYLDDFDGCYFPDQDYTYKPAKYRWWNWTQKYVGQELRLMFCPTYSYPVWEFKSWSYGYNMDFNYRSRSEVNPESILITDAWWHWCSVKHGNRFGIPQFAWTVLTNRVHSGSANFLFADGRVEWRPFDELTDLLFIPIRD